MPFTPFHWGPASWIGLLCFRSIDIFAFLIGSIIIDIEPFLVLVFNLNYPLHGFFHSFLGGTIAAGLVSGLLYRFRGATKRLMGFFKLAQESSGSTMFISCLLGVYSHIFFDSFLYSDIKPFFPLSVNPFYRLLFSHFVYLFCGVSFISGLSLYGAQISKGRTKTVLKAACILSFVALLMIMAGLKH